MSEINVIANGSFVEVHFPYHAEAKTRIKNMGGRWNGTCWLVKPEMEADARRVLFDVFGTDGAVGLKKVTLRVRAKKDLVQHHEYGPITCCGKVLARAFGRDSGARVGEDVVLIDGNIRSGGSMKNWTVRIDAGSEFKLVNVFPALMDEYDKDAFDVEVVGDGDAVLTPLAAYSDEDLLAEVRRRGLTV